MARAQLLVTLTLLVGGTTCQWSLWTEWSDCPACSPQLGEESTRSRRKLCSGPEICVEAGETYPLASQISEVGDCEAVRACTLEEEDCQSATEHCLSLNITTSSSNLARCQANPCLNNGTCLENSLSSLCQCKPGYFGSRCEKEIDECQSSPCLHGSCLDLENAFLCDCEEGYEGDLCDTDKDDCWDDPCHNDGFCIDQVNGYQCQCQEGFEGQNCEIDIIECEASPCQNRGVCVNYVPGYECICGDGFEGKHCEINIDDCEDVTCSNQGACQDQVNGYTCSCAPGFTGLHCEQEINECLDVVCQHGGSCSDLVNGYKCDCIPGYTGSTCEVNINDCVANQCQHGATCHDLVNGFRCECSKGFQGDYCEVNIDECEEQPCLNGGSCEEYENTYKCSCAPGYEGRNCEVNINECADSPCSHGATCIDLENNFKCQCQPGFTGMTCGDQIDECELEPCKNGGVCRDQINGYECECLPGFTGVNCEININECESKPCKNNATCLDLENRFECKCLEGFEGHQCQLDVDECLQSPCENSGTCKNEVPSFSCLCPPGYMGKTCQIKLNQCETVNCQNNGTCEERKDNGFKCSCVLGFEGKFCEININDCEDDPCQGEASYCYDLVNNYECKCQAGLEGKSCEFNIDECAPEPCLHGTCEDGIGDYSCHCYPGYSGRNCTQNTDECKSLPCLHGGSCQDLINDYSCTCKAGYEGRNCEVDINECQRMPCQNGGSCLDRVNGYFCECQPGFSGERCEVKIDECDRNKCLNGGRCESLINDFKCNCKPGFEGKKCEIDIDDCSEVPCMHGGTCRDGNNSYSCICPEEFKGETCQYRIDDCAENPCDHGTCFDGINSYHCVCDPGYNGTNCDQNIDDCKNYPCQNNGSCDDLINDVRCNCQPGYEGKYCEIDIDECSKFKDPCGKRGLCMNLINNWKCDCEKGWEGKKCDVNINECLSQPCLNGGSCSDEIGQYSCHCLPGYHGLNCELDVDECNSLPCQNGASCLDLKNNYACDCVPGYTGRNCEININDCEVNPCKNNATCEDKTADFFCKCNIGFRGKMCQDEINECEPDPCINGGKCSDLVGDYFCDCLVTGFKGKNCEININECELSQCQNGATCVDKVNDYICDCLPGYTGTHCEAEINECLSSPCKNANNCTDKLDDYDCQCKLGFEGKNCEVNINECSQSECREEQPGVRYCVDGTNDYDCICEDGFSGKNCETNIDDCANHECANNSTCIDDVNKYTCQCLQGFSGDLCKNNINECDDRPCENGICEDKIDDFSCSCLKGYTGKNCDNCTKPEDCNISTGCCFGAIIFNSARHLRSRKQLLPYKNLTEFFGIYKLFSYEEKSKSKRMIFQKDEDREVKKRIHYNPELKIWEVRQEAEGTFPKPYWYFPRDEKCVAKSTDKERNKNPWYFMLGEEVVYHEIDVQCAKSSTNLESCGPEEFLCDDRKQCVPSYWVCDGIVDCSDGSDECPVINQNVEINIDNDIKSNPKLTVVGNVHIDRNLYSDPSNTMQNITVSVSKAGKSIEDHTCEFVGRQQRELSMYEAHQHDTHCGLNNTRLHFTKLEVAVGYTFNIKLCNKAGCVNKTVEHDTTNWNCGPEDEHKIISTRQICDSKNDCPIGKRDEQEIICQGSPFARNISLTIFLYMFLVLLLFALVKKKGYFKCSKHPNNPQDVAAIANEVVHLKSLMASKSGVEFKMTYSQCHEDKDSHSMLASMINYILVHKKNKELKDQTFRRMNEVECEFHSTPQGYYKCIRSRFTDSLVIKKYVRCLEDWRATGGSTVRDGLRRFRRWLLPDWSNKAMQFICCGLAFNLNITHAPNQKRSKFKIAASNHFFWLHFLIVLFNLGDLVKDITFTAAVQHFDRNIVQDFQTADGEIVSRYQQYYDFNVYYVFITSVGLILFSQAVTYIYWTMISRKPNFLMSCEHQGIMSRIAQILIQYLPSTLPILLFAQDTSVKIAIGEREDSDMDPAQFMDHLELLFEQRLVEKISLNIKIIEVVCETYGQLIVQSVVLLRLKTLIQTDYFNYFGIKFEFIIMLSMVLSVLSLFTTFWSYHTRSKQRFRRLLSSSTFLQLITWILLIITKLAIYVISFINFPGLFFVPVLIQFCVTLLVLTFTNVSPSFRASAWHDRLIHCMVCCVLPLAVSDDPQWQLQDVSIDKFRKPVKQEDDNDKEGPESEGDTNHSFENDDGSLQSFGSITRILKKDKRTLKRTNTCYAEFEKKSRNEMMLALFLYTFECISVTAFSAIMYQFYHFEKYREFLKHFVEVYFSFVPFIEGFYGVVILMVISVLIVVLLSSVLIITYYKRLHPRLNMFSAYSNASKGMVEDTVNTVGLILTTRDQRPGTAEYFV